MVILIYFPKENTISSLKFEKLDSEEQEKITKSSEFNFYNQRTFKKEISFTENDSIFSVKELINGNLIFFFNEYFKIYNIFKKNLAEIQKINYSTNNSIYYLNFLEISSTEFLLNKGDKEHEREKYRTYKREDKKVENVLTKIFTLDKNKRLIDKEIPNFPFGKILKFKDTFILIQTYFDPNYS